MSAESPKTKADGFLAGAESDGEVGGKRSLEGGTEEERAAKMMREAAADYQLTSGAYGNRGIKAQLEDVEIQVPDLSVYGSALAGVRSAFYAVYDGHAGRSAAEYCAEHLHAKIASKIEAPSDNDQVRKAITDGFKETDQAYITLANQKGYKDGCTAVTLIVMKDVCFVAWVGDSKCILGRRETEDKTSRLKALTVTKDHTCMQVKERDRIIKNGGFIENNRVNAVMEVTRSIGDVQLKKSGVISVPQIERVTLNKRDEFFLLACDGLWAVMDAKEAVERVMRALQEGKDEDTAAMELVREAVRVREAKDNVTAMVVRIHPTKK